MTDRAMSWRFTALELALFTFLTPWPLTLLATGTAFIFGIAFNDTDQPLDGLYAQLRHFFGFVFAVGAGPGLLAGIVHAALRYRGVGFVARLIASVAAAFAATVAAALLGWKSHAWLLIALAGQCEACGAAGAAMMVGLIDTRRLRAAR
jgi:hypothetical protein